MPAYNRACLIERAIKSVLKQEYPNWELIISDDGSTDNTKKIVSKYLSDDRINYISYKENKGVNYARNRAIEKATGDIIIFLDSDDEFYEYTLSKAKEYIEKYDYDVYSFTTIKNNGQIFSELKQDMQIFTYEEFLTKMYFTEFLKVVKKHVFKSIKFEDDIHAHEGITWGQIEKKYKSVYINCALRLYWENESSILRDNDKWTDKKELNNKKAYERYINTFKVDLLGMKSGKKMLAQYYGRLGRSCINLGDLKNGRKYTIEALKHNCTELRVLRNFALLIKKNFAKG